MNLKFYFKELKVYILYKLKQPIPCAAVIRPTFRCNLNCYFCSIKKFPKIKKELSTEQIFSLIDDLHKIGVPYVSLTGGEPLLRSDIEDIGFYLQKKGIIAALSTNGTLITKERAGKLSRAYDSIRISFDGFGETHNKIRGVKKAYELAFEGLNKLLNSKNRTAKIGIHFVLTNYNSQELTKLVDAFKGKVDIFSVMPVYFHDENKIELNPQVLSFWHEIQKELKQHRLCNQSDEFLKNPSFKTGKKYCDAGKLYYAFNPTGDVTACSFRPFSVGNINQEPFYKIWKRGLNEKTKRQIKNCPGCYIRCTTEMSMLFRKSPFELLKELISILKTYKY